MPEPLLNDSPPSRNSVTLGELCQSCARKAGERQLLSLVILGVLAAAISGALVVGSGPGWMANWWPLLVPLLVLGSFGVWAIADREVTAHRTDRRDSARTLAALIATRWLAAAVLVAVLGLALLYGLFVALGTWIS